MRSKPVVHHIAASIQGRYILDIPPSPAPHSLLVGFHGYGENAENNVEQISQIPGSHAWLRCSIQALHPFYNRKTDEVVASWMTRLDRERAIRQNIIYVGNVIRRIKTEGKISQLVYLGFSQGVAMAYRAAFLTHHKCKGLIILAGDLPSELEHTPISAPPSILLARGSRDSWYTQKKMDVDLERLKIKGLKVKSLVFEGGHEWSQKFLEVAGQFLQQISQ